MKTIIKTLLALSLLMIFSCGGGDDVNFASPIQKEDPDQNQEGAPHSAILKFPENNKECTEGTIISENENKILFQWNASNNTDNYEITIENLQTNETQVLVAEKNELEVILQRGVAYQWFVTSKNTETGLTAVSDSWRFYNAGEGILNHIPFPAEVIYPENDSQLEASMSNINLEWSGTDIDSDIVEYEIFYGEANPPEVSLGTVTSPNKEVSISTGTNYYWKIITKDKAGNSSHSQVFWFGVK